VGYRVELTKSAQRDLDTIPPKYAVAILQYAYGLLADNPARAGKPLVGDLEGLHSARRGDYRIVYEILTDQQNEGTVLIHRIRHRAHVYRPR
jgi:mRNA-degrading endonuclease RelE of RelBE toxin-antitoxin system